MGLGAARAAATHRHVREGAAAFPALLQGFPAASPLAGAGAGVGSHRSPDGASAGQNPPGADTAPAPAKAEPSLRCLLALAASMALQVVAGT